MYTTQDINRALTERNKRIVLAAVMMALAILCIVIGALIRNKPLMMIGPSVFGCLFYFLWEFKAMPYARYARYLSDINTGLSHETEARFVSMSEQPRLNNGVMYYDFIVSVGSEPEDERLFYFDADKPKPSIPEGENLSITSFGNYITNLETAPST
ncbi:hypothetical protein LJC33_03805 [Eubacteriales bacterium OttesenSCG-928-N13]|nr:hypothetical protein [Eubacteriales bacterium OttesenSCG-928-N13]